MKVLNTFFYIILVFEPTTLVACQNSVKFNQHVITEFMKRVADIEPEKEDKVFVDSLNDHTLGVIWVEDEDYVQKVLKADESTAQAFGRSLVLYKDTTLNLSEGFWKVCNYKEHGSQVCGLLTPERYELILLFVIPEG